MKTKPKTRSAIWTPAILLILSGPMCAQLLIHQAVELEIQSEVENCYQIQESTNLATWFDYGNPIPGTGESIFKLLSTRGEEKRFYRAETVGASAFMEIDVPSYANLCGRWNYRRTEGGTGSITDWAVKILGTRKENGEPIYLSQEYDDYGYPNDQFFYQTGMDSGLFEMGILGDYGQPSEFKAFWQTAVPRLKASFVPGQEYLTQHSRPDIPYGTLTLHTTMQVETITVPYGTLECIKVSQFFSVGEETGGGETRWYAEHVGLVKRIQNDNGDVWELVTYQP